MSKMPLQSLGFEIFPDCTGVTFCPIGLETRFNLYSAFAPHFGYEKQALEEYKPNAIKVCQQIYSHLGSCTRQIVGQADGVSDPKSAQ